MRIELRNVSKRFHNQWVFRNINYDIEEKEVIAISGPNGSGKSTLLKIISSYIDPTLGSVHYFKDAMEVPYEEIPLLTGICSPELSLIQEFTMEEQLKFHFTFRKSLGKISEMAQVSGLADAMQKTIQEFSSGMKQRLKLLLALYTDSRIILLDEPTSNMDEQGIDWYLREMKSNLGKRTIIIASNQRYEYEFSNRILEISDYR